MPNKKKIVLAAGGTGGHVFPAQALARDLMDLQEEIELLFVGGKLSSNRYFQKEQFPFKEVSCATPFRSEMVRSIFAIGKGVRESMRHLKSFRPDLVIGFGSFYAFPVLTAALLMGIPFILFEPNSIAGKVNRFLSRWALFSAVQFEETKRDLKGNAHLVHLPFWGREKGNCTREEARAYYGLDMHRPTLLVFGGSQGANAINRLFFDLSLPKDLQLIHITGDESLVEPLNESYRKQSITACVKHFEDQMQFAWRAADLALCRAGAATLGEMVAFNVPGILVPFAQAADDHQSVNADIFEKKIKGGIHLPEKEMTSSKLSSLLSSLFDPQHHRIESMKQAIEQFKSQDQKEEFSKLIINHFKP